MLFFTSKKLAHNFKTLLPSSVWNREDYAGLELGIFLLRTESELVLKSRQVVPGRLLNGGFQFTYPRWPEAAQDLVTRWRKSVS